MFEKARGTFGEIIRIIKPLLDRPEAGCYTCRKQKKPQRLYFSHP